MKEKENEKKFINSISKAPQALKELFKLEKAKSTNELLKIIPEEKLSFLVAFMKLSCIKISEFKESLGYYHNYPKTEIKKINEALANLKKKKWLSDIGINNIERTLKEQMVHSINGRKYLASKELNEQSRTGGLPKNYALSVLYYCILDIIDCVKEKTKKTKYALIADFLCEQGLTDEVGISPTAIRNIHKRKNKDELFKFISKNQAIMDLMCKLQFNENLSKEEHQKVITFFK